MASLAGPFSPHAQLPAARCYDSGAAPVDPRLTPSEGPWDRDPPPTPIWTPTFNKERP